MQTDTFQIREVSECCFFHGFEYEDGKWWNVSESVGVRMSCYAALRLYRHTNFQRCAVRLPELRVQPLQSWIASLLAHVNWVMPSHATWSCHLHRFFPQFQQPQLLLQFFSKALQPEVFQSKTLSQTEAFDMYTVYLWYLMILSMNTPDCLDTVSV